MVGGAGPEPLAVRHGVAGDVDALLSFWAAAGENDGRPPDTAEAVDRLIAHDPEAVLVGEFGGVLAATLVVGWDGWRANLYRLAVDSTHRGRGLARQMLRHAEERVVELGVDRLCAMVLDENHAGAAFWSAAGYAPRQDWRRWVKTLR
ncbi:GNAT family N-acetyltransferase [uncultured Nocardioides sp.]|uniref:GNAT family N-acetyltransferase n=1 Tax=uncultured Nocardioides sp. TaxID=198441 RepID=UPI00263551FF|nr:GNAT family N-acetyltransferase [uncultured Nocardioides sp.]